MNEETGQQRLLKNDKRMKRKTSASKRGGGYDEAQTPAYAIQPLLPYLPKFSGLVGQGRYWVRWQAEKCASFCTAAELVIATKYD